MGDSGGGVTTKKQKKTGVVPGAGDSANDSGDIGRGVGAVHAVSWCRCHACCLFFFVAVV